ncbi:GNAT family N-acetyltransferase [Albimonas sp. CAU 1670]|uniref:GNAT family N-acetyltransferase n=1 Tax=Albimonas sp. CAU 1670 TaxID=3032599 RepID=UPI0023DADAAA|nr:GNAT family N-acetyltransferase [Albimonas sp. CAU 1670]MDF2233051.1 GNAT family N-acetyltransferase [Albimonas sp. CAU 1670]
MPAAIRPAVPSDAPALSALVREAFALYVDRMGKEPAPMSQDFPADIAAGRCWAADGPEGLLGLVVAYDDGPAEDPSFHLETVAVSPAAQGTGLGRALIAFAEAEARRRGLPCVRLYTNAKMVENLALYPRLGYVETGRRAEKGFERVFFEKPLPPMSAS